jgi:hypothetical protein
LHLQQRGGNSTVCDSAYCGAIQLSSDGGVANGTTIGVSAAPTADSTNYLYGVNGVNPLGFQGAEVIFNPANGEPVFRTHSISTGAPLTR